MKRGDGHATQMRGMHRKCVSGVWYEMFALTHSQQLISYTLAKPHSHHERTSVGTVMQRNAGGAAQMRLWRVDTDACFHNLPEIIFLCTAVRLYGCTVVRLYGCAAKRLYGCAAVRLYGCTAVRLYGCTAVRLYGYTVVRLYGCTAVRQYGCTVVRSQVALTRTL